MDHRCRDDQQLLTKDIFTRQMSSVVNRIGQRETPI